MESSRLYLRRVLLYNRPMPGWEAEPEELCFAQLREYVRLHGDTELVQALRQETRERLKHIQAAWPSDWTYD